MFIDDFKNLKSYVFARINFVALCEGKVNVKGDQFKLPGKFVLDFDDSRYIVLP